MNPKNTHNFKPPRNEYPRFPRVVWIIRAIRLGQEVFVAGFFLHSETAQRFHYPAATVAQLSSPCLHWLTRSAEGSDWCIKQCRKSQTMTLLVFTLVGEEFSEHFVKNVHVFMFFFFYFLSSFVSSLSDFYLHIIALRPVTFTLGSSFVILYYCCCFSRGKFGRTAATKKSADDTDKEGEIR